jgi:hypothetical protein
LSNKFQLQRLLTSEEIETRVWATVVIIVTIILAGIVIFMLYSLAFVVQPIKSMAPIDMAFSKMLNDIVLLIVGGIGGVMSRKGVQAVADKLATPTPSSPAPTTPTIASPAAAPTPTPTPSGMPDFNFMGFKNPELDESWRAPPPPTTPANYIDPSKEEIANERAVAKLEVQ